MENKNLNFVKIIVDHQIFFGMGIIKNLNKKQYKLAINCLLIHLLKHILNIFSYSQKI